ncbi:MAG: hypothetical protein DLM54_03865 [Acidimicrobiales bacterium]|nr:MAG: hypothetical protein DLM54_03865 [Acidimicrobiales bacterium]
MGLVICSPAGSRAPGPDASSLVPARGRHASARGPRLEGAMRRLAWLEGRPVRGSGRLLAGWLEVTWS